MRNKGGGVNIVDDGEYFGRFVLASQHKEHLHFTARVEAVAADGGASTLCVDVDGTPNLLVFLGYDEELHRLMHHVHHLIYADGEDKEENVAVNHLFPIA